MTMKKPAIANLTHRERKELIDSVSNNSYDEKEKTTVIEALGFIDKLIMDLETSKISIATLKKLFGSQSEQLKKLLQVL